MKRTWIMMIGCLMAISLTCCKSAKVIQSNELPEGARSTIPVETSIEALNGLEDKGWTTLTNGIIVRRDGDALIMDIPVEPMIRAQSVPSKTVDRSTNINQNGEKNLASIGRNSSPQQGSGLVAGNRNSTNAIQGDGNKLDSNTPQKKSWFANFLNRMALPAFFFIVLLWIVIMLIRKKTS